MAVPLSLWRDRLGYLHPSEASADAADRLLATLTEREARRAIVRRLLVKRIDAHDGRRLLASDVSGQEAADWIIANWSALAAIGLSYRLHELEAAPLVDLAVACAATSPIMHGEAIRS